MKEAITFLMLVGLILIFNRCLSLNVPDITFNNYEYLRGLIDEAKVLIKDERKKGSAVFEQRYINDFEQKIERLEVVIAEHKKGKIHRKELVNAKKGFRKSLKEFRTVTETV